VKHGEGNTNSPEFLLLKILPLAYHHSDFLAATLNFTSFFTRGRTLFLQLGCFGLDIYLRIALALACIYQCGLLACYASAVLHTIILSQKNLRCKKGKLKKVQVTE